MSMTVSVPTTDMSMTCLRTNYRYVYVSVPTTDMSMTCLRNSYRYVYDLSPYQLQICLWLSPYQLQICLWPVSVTATDMSLICPRTNHYTPCSSGPLLIAKPPKTIYMYVRPILTASPQQLHIVLNPIITDHLNDLKSDTPLAFAPH